MVWRALLLIVLGLGVAGFGLCSLCSGIYGLSSKSAREFLGLSLLTAVLTVLCWVGLRKVHRRMVKPTADKPSALPPPPPPPPSSAA